MKAEDILFHFAYDGLSIFAFNYYVKSRQSLDVIYFFVLHIITGKKLLIACDIQGIYQE